MQNKGLFSGVNTLKALTLLIISIILLSSCTSKQASQSHTDGSAIGSSSIGESGALLSDEASSDGGHFEFSTVADLNSNGENEKLELTIENYTTPTLTVGKQSITFSTLNTSTFDKATFKICPISDSASLIFIRTGSDFYLCCALYQDGQLSEIPLFPFSFEEAYNELFEGKWTSSDSFRIKCALGGDVLKCKINKAALKEITGSDFSDYDIAGSFDHGEYNNSFYIYDIEADGTVIVTGSLNYDTNKTIADIQLELTYNDNEKSFELSNLTYSVADGCTVIRVK